MTSKGYDVVYVDDISATTSPEAAYGMVRYNANLNGECPAESHIVEVAHPADFSGLDLGFIGNSSDIIAALGV